MRRFIERHIAKFFWAVAALSFVVLLVETVGVAGAGAIKVWSNSDYVRAADLNSNFAHIHNLMVGGHGARLMDGDVNPTAAIGMTKLSTPSILPKAWADLGNVVCTVGTCPLVSSARITSIVWNGAGSYTVTLGYTSGASNDYLVIASSHTPGVPLCAVSAYTSTTQFNLICDTTGAVATNAAFAILVMDTSAGGL